MLHLCSRIAAHAFATEVPVLRWYSSRVLLSCCSFHSIAVTHFVYSDPCLNHGSDQAITLWLFHISLHPVFLLCSPLVPNFNWFSDHVSPFLLSQAVCLWVPKDTLQKTSAAQFYSCFDFYCMFLIVCFGWSILSGPYTCQEICNTMGKMSISFCHRFLPTQVWKVFPGKPYQLFNPSFCIEDPLI